MNASTASSTSAAGVRGERQEATLPVGPKENSFQPPTFFVGGFAILFASIFGYAVHQSGASITGPFIFGDELEYFLYGHDLFAGADLSHHVQYGVLYPLIMAILFHFGDVVSVYHWMRAFNVVVFASSVIPVFLLVRALFPHDRALWLLLSLLAATISFSAYSDLIWADPLYLTLFQWSVLSLCVFYERPQIATGCMTGVLLGLLFHTKPGAGLVVEVAAVVSLVALFSGEAKRPYRRTALGAALAIVVVCGVLTVPWIVRNLTLGVGPIGYQSNAQNLKTLIAEMGAFEVAKRTVLSAFYQLSYFFVATWGLLGVLIVTPFLRWKARPETFRGLTVFLAACVVGLIALVSLGSNSDKEGQEYWMPFGRYLSVACPTIVILALHLLRFNPNSDQREKRYLITLTAILTVITVCATPLLAILPRSIVNASDLALAMAVVDKGGVIWRHSYEATLFGRVGFAALFACFGLMGILAMKRPNAFYGFVGLVLVGSLMTSLAELRYMRVLGASQSPMNDAVRFLRDQGADFEHAVGIDRRFQGGNIGPMVDFWTTSRLSLRYLSASELEQRSREWDLKYFVSPEALSFPPVFSAPGLYVYLLKDQTADGFCIGGSCVRRISFGQSHEFEINLKQSGNGASFTDDH